MLISEFICKYLFLNQHVMVYHLVKNLLIKNLLDSLVMVLPYALVHLDSLVMVLPCALVLPYCFLPYALVFLPCCFLPYALVNYYLHDN